MAKKHLSNVDTAWLRMEDPTNLMMITGVMVFGAPIDAERLKATLQFGLLRFDRFRQKVSWPLQPGGKPYWEDDPDFDIDYHLQRATLPPPGDQATLQELASLLSSTQLDFSRPLWQFHLVDSYGDGCALICRLHHCIGDGLALVYVLLSLTGTEPDASWPAYRPAAPSRGDRNPLQKITQPVRSAFEATQKVAGTLVRECREVRADPSRIAQAARVGGNGAAALARLLLLWPDPKTRFKGELGVPKRTAWSTAIDLKDVKTIGKAMGGTVNDVLLTATSGGLRRYLQDRSEPVEGLNFRAVIPVNLRQPGTEHELGNKFGLFFLSLPIGIADSQERLGELKLRMDALKGSLEAPVAFGILNTIGMMPETIQDIVVNIFGMKGTAVMTNVVGPPVRLYLAGAPLESLMFWVPQSGRLGMGVSILSYAGKVWVGFITDTGLVPDPDKIVAGFQAEFNALLETAHNVAPATGIQDMTIKLDKALSTLESVAEEHSLAPQGGVGMAEAPGDTPDRCQALTAAGKPCKNRPLLGSNYCRVHQE